MSLCPVACRGDDCGEKDNRMRFSSILLKFPLGMSARCPIPFRVHLGLVLFKLQASKPDPLTHSSQFTQQRDDGSHAGQIADKNAVAPGMPLHVWRGRRAS